MEKISIIVVCFNEKPSGISFTLDSVLAQTYGNKEVVVIDGGSKKETIDCLDKYATKGITYFSKPDQGIYHAMNRGIDASTGQWLIFMNMRDRFHDANVLQLSL